MSSREQKFKSLLGFVVLMSYATIAQCQEATGASSVYSPTPTPSPTCSSTPTKTPTPSPTATRTPTRTATNTATNTATPSSTSSPTQTPISTATTTPGATNTATPTIVAPTPQTTATPVDVLVPFGCESQNNADIIASLDSSAQKILKVSKLTANSLRKSDRSAKTSAFIKKTLATVQALNSQAWTQAWTIPTGVTINCISYSAALCEKKDLTPLVELYNKSVMQMNAETLKLNRKLKVFDRKAAAKLGSALRASLEESLTTSDTLKVETLECKSGTTK